jgi:hemoglobin/transferrin/lactoferrin receptor protein
MKDTGNHIKLFLFMLLLALGSVVNAQELLKVINLSDLNPVENVLIRGREKELLTDVNGTADLSVFRDDEMLTIQHPNYRTVRFTVKELREKGLELALSETVLKLGEVVLSASKWEAAEEALPLHVSKMTLREIRFNNPSTSADMLGHSGEVFIQKSQLGGGSPMIRGFSANRVLITVDGIRMNNAIFRSGNLQNVISIDPHSVLNSEVIFGPGTVSYGSDALGGVMDFQSLKTYVSPNEATYVYGNALLRYGSAANEGTAHIDIGVKTRNFGIISSLSYTSFGDLRQGSHGPDDYLRKEYVKTMDGKDSIVQNADPLVQRFSGYDQLNLLQKIRYAKGPWNVEYSLHYSITSDVPRYDRLTQYREGDLRYAEWYYGPQKWILNSFRVENSKSTTMYDKVRFILGYQIFEESRNDRVLNGNELRSRTENVRAYQANVDFEKQWNRANFYYGIEGLFNTVGSEGQQRALDDLEWVPIASRYPDGSTWSSYSAYGQFEIPVNEKLQWSTGVRLNYVGSRSDFDTTFYPFPFSEANLDNVALNGSFGFNYRPTDQWVIKGNLGTAFRAPNIDDIGKVFDSGEGIVIVPNPELESEYVYNFDLGVRRYVRESIEIQVTGFFSLLTNVMARRPYSLDGQDSIWYDGTYSEVHALQNVDGAYITGIQFALFYDLSPQWSTVVRANYQHGRASDGDYLRHVAPFFGMWSLVYQKAKFKSELSYVLNGAIRSDRLAFSERDKAWIYALDENGLPYSPSWSRFDIKFSYQVMKEFQMNFGLENIFDIRYRPYSSGISGAGRNIFIAARSSF